MKSLKAVFCTLLLVSPFLTIYSQPLINEISPANASEFIDPDFFNFPGWIELHNPSSDLMDLSGYYLTTDPAEPAKWRFPAGTSIAAGAYLLLYCDERNTSVHTNFKLDDKAGELYLLSPGFQILDHVTYALTYTNVSWGRAADTGEWAFLESPSPAAPNGSACGNERLTKPQASLPSGRYSAAIGLRVSHEQGASVTIRYTTDGSEPSLESPPYTEKITLRETAVLKIKAFKAGFIPSETAAFTYFIAEPVFSLPVVSLSTAPANLWDEQVGIYTSGVNGISGNCIETPVNWNQDWERHATLQLFDPSGFEKFSQDVDIRIHGGCSRSVPQKSFAIKARDKYGDNHLDYSFFKSKPVDRFGGLVLRNGGNDNHKGTLFRDALMQGLLIGHMDIDYQAYQPAVLYVNGQYWGIQNIREKIDGDYLESNYGIDQDDIDLLENNGVAVEGTADAYNAYLAGLQSRDMTDPSAFVYINQHIDVQEYINYMVVEIYFANTDWPGNNIKFWRQRSTNGKFRWILWDTDFGFGLIKTDPSMASHPTLAFATAEGNTAWPNPDWSTLHFRLLLKNPEFRAKFIATMQAALATTFHPDRVIEEINALQSGISGEIGRHLGRWGGDTGQWWQEVQVLRDFAVYRHAFMKQHLVDFFQLNEEVNLSFQTAEGGGYRLNGVFSDAPASLARVEKGAGFHIQAVPASGYTFERCVVTSYPATETVVVAKGDKWKFFDEGLEPPGSWTEAAYDESAWKEGTGRFGYGDGKEATLISFGANSQQKYTTAYFRKSVYIGDPQQPDSLEASILFDDGAVVYLNGQEVYRGNMPDGELSFNTPAASKVYGEDIYLTFRIPADKLKASENQLAVEVHQVTGHSTDLSFDLALRAYSFGQPVEEVFTGPSFELNGQAQSNMSFQLFFEPDASFSRLIINEISPSRGAGIRDEYGEEEDWVEIYNPGNAAVNLNGFFITDDFTNPRKFQLLADAGELVIEPRGYLVLWADEHEHQGPTHLGFKLSADGEDLGLYQLLGGDWIVHDETKFGFVSGDYTFARIPDGSGPLVPTARPTPSAPNVQTSVDNDELEVSFYPNPAESFIFVKSLQPIDKVEVYNLLSGLCQQLQTSAGEPIPVSHLKPGVYVFRVYSGDSIHDSKIIIF